jgi:flagellin
MADINLSVNTDQAAMTANRYIKINRTKEQQAAAELSSGIRTSNPAYDPSSAAVAANITATAEAQDQANRNVAQAGAQIGTVSNALGTLQSNLIRMKVLTVQSNSDTISTDERIMLDQEFQALLSNVDIIASNTRWGGVSLLTGGPGSATAGAAVVAAPAAVGLTAVANAFQNTISAGTTQGLVSGIATSATVNANGALFDVYVVIGPQTFKATVGAPTVGGTLTLVSTTDSGNSISFLYDAGSVAAFTGTAASFQTNLQGMLGVNTAAQAVFSSINTTAGGIVGVTVTPGVGSNAGTWALTYTGAAAGGTGVFKLTRGNESYTVNLEDTVAATTAVTSLSFNNGTTLSLAVGFNGTTNIAQEIYTFTAGTQVDSTIQYGENASDTLTLTYNGAGATALGVNGLSVGTALNAAIASVAIDNALNTISNQVATLGGKLSQLNFIADNLAVSIQNLNTTKGTFIDTSISDALAEQQQYIVLGKISSAIFAKALSREGEIVQMVQSVQ